MTAPDPPPPTTPDAFDPAGSIRDLYRHAELLLLGYVAAAVEATILDPAQQALAEARLRRQTRGVVAMLNTAAPNLVEQVLAASVAEGERRGQDE